jgi:hypothetical protein
MRPREVLIRKREEGGEGRVEWLSVREGVCPVERRQISTIQAIEVEEIGVGIEEGVESVDRAQCEVNFVRSERMFVEASVLVHEEDGRWETLEGAQHLVRLFKSALRESSIKIVHEVQRNGVPGIVHGGRRVEVIVYSLRTVRAGYMPSRIAELEQAC